MKNILIYICGFISALVICASSALLYSAKDIEYTNTNSNVTNVADALNEIYSSGDATSDDITLGKTALIQGNLVSGTRISDADRINKNNFASGLNISVTSGKHYLCSYTYWGGGLSTSLKSGGTIIKNSNIINTSIYNNEYQFLRTSLIKATANTLSFNGNSSWSLVMCIQID